jgi:hypothetical protein
MVYACAGILVISMVVWKLMVTVLSRGETMIALLVIFGSLQ